jgi:uncharacterized DUF497 family protein
MGWLHVIWDSVSPRGNLAKVQEHGLTADDVEGVLFNPESSGTSRRSGRPLAFGRVADGRAICVVYLQIDAITVQPVTAFVVDAEER